MGHNKEEYSARYNGIDFRKHPEKYRIGRGEQGVLMAEPYKSEIGPHWKFRTPEIAQKSAAKIYQMFETYLLQNDFVGADMCRKYVMMGWTRSRRYANHKSGKKYDEDRNILPLEADRFSSLKAQSANIFEGFYVRMKMNNQYVKLKEEHKKLWARSSHS